MEIAPRISVDEKVRFGRPVISGTRVPADLILSKLAGEMTYKEVMDEYEITRENMPRSTGNILKEYGYNVRDIRDHGLRGEADSRDKIIAMND